MKREENIKVKDKDVERGINGEDGNGMRNKSNEHRDIFYEN